MRKTLWPMLALFLLLSGCGGRNEKSVIYLYPTERTEVSVTPKPDSVLRVFMAYKPLDAPVELPEQTLTPVARAGFALVEWGGAECAP